MKSNHKNFVQLVGLYTYCGMMHGAYNVIFNSTRHLSNTNPKHLLQAEQNPLLFLKKKKNLKLPTKCIWQRSTRSK